MDLSLETVGKKELRIVSLVLGVFLTGVLAGIMYSEHGSSRIESVDLSVEANSSESIKTVSFFNRSIDILVEDGINSTFYLDKNRDGSADEILEIKRDGEIHQSVQFLDYRNNIYRLYYRYSDDPQVEEDGWMEVYQADKLK